MALSQISTAHLYITDSIVIDGLLCVCVCVTRSGPLGINDRGYKVLKANVGV